MPRRGKELTTQQIRVNSSRALRTLFNKRNPHLRAPQTYYVDNAGSDAADGKTPATAWKTIGHVNSASPILSPGDSLLFQGGQTFNDTDLEIYASGTPTSPVTIGSYGTGRATIGAGTWNVGFHYQTWQNLIFLGNASIMAFQSGNETTNSNGIIVQNCLIDGQSDTTLTGAVRLGSTINGTNNQVLNCTIQNTGLSGIQVTGINGVIDSCTITNVGLRSPGSPNPSVAFNAHGIYLGDSGFDTHGWAVTNNTISNPGLVDAMESAVSQRFRSATITGNIFHDCSIGIDFYESDSIGGTTYWLNNTIYNTDQAGLYVQGPSGGDFSTTESFVINGNTIGPISAGTPFINVQASYTSGTVSIGPNNFIDSTTDTSLTSDGAIRATFASRTTAETTLSSDSASGTVTSSGISRTAADTSLTTDTATRVVARSRTSTDTSNTTDTATRSIQLSRTGSDTSNTSDTATRIIAESRTATDTSLTSDSAIRALVESRTGSDTSNTSDIATRHLVLSRTSSDTSNTSDIAIRSAISFARTASDTSLTSDTATRILVLVRTTSDTSLTSDAAVGIVGKARTTSDTSLTTDTAVRSAMVFSRTALDTSNTSDAATRSLVLHRTSSDTSLTTDSAVRSVQAFTRTTSDTSNTSDTATRTVILSRSSSDTSSTTDAATRLLAFARTGSDTSSTTDAATRHLVLARTGSDTSLTTDSAASGGGGGNRTTSDTTLTSDTIRSFSTFTRSALNPALVTLVGAQGAAVSGISGAAVTPSFGAGASRTAGNLLVCFVTGGGHSGPAPSASGWTVLAQGMGAPAFVVSAIMYKWATGGDAAPTIGAVAGMNWTASLAEYTGLATNSTPVSNGSTTTGSSVTVALGSTDPYPGALVLSASIASYGTLGARTLGVTFNNGATDVPQNNNGASAIYHYSLDYGITNANTVSDQETSTVGSITNYNGTAAMLVSFQPALVPDTSLTSDTISSNVTLSHTASDTSLSSDSPTRGAFHFARTTSDISLTTDSAVNSNVHGPRICPPTNVNITAYIASEVITAYTASGLIRAYVAAAVIAGGYSSFESIRAYTSSESIAGGYTSNESIRNYTSGGGIVTYTSTATIRSYTSTENISNCGGG